MSSWSGKKARKPKSTLYGGPIDDERFTGVFAKRVAEILASHTHLSPKNADAWDALQKEQIEGVVGLELECRRVLIQDERGYQAYEAFVNMIMDERRTSSAAQPYFREPEVKFVPDIAPPLRQRQIRVLYQFHVNYTFFRWVYDQPRFGWKRTDPFVVAFRKLEKLRTAVVELNLPLAISRARMFWNKTPKSHLQYLDLVQLGVEGLCRGIDKFRLPYSRVFRSVAIGQMTNLFMDRYSDTTIRFASLDRSRIYRANKAGRRITQGTAPDFEVLALAANKDRPLDQAISADDLAQLMSATGPLSINYRYSTAAGGVAEEYEFGDRLAAPEDQRPDAVLEREERDGELHDAVRRLPLLHQKLVCLRMGLDLGPPLV